MTAALKLVTEETADLVKRPHVFKGIACIPGKLTATKVHIAAVSAEALKLARAKINKGHPLLILSLVYDDDGQTRYQGAKLTPEAARRLAQRLNAQADALEDEDARHDRRVRTCNGRARNDTREADK